MSDSPGPYKGVKLAMEAIERARDAVRRAAQTQRPEDWETAAQLFQEAAPLADDAYKAWREEGKDLKIEAANCRTRARLARGAS